MSARATIKEADYFEPFESQDNTELNKFGMKEMDKGYINIESLKFFPVYQRKLEKRRWQQVLNSMEKVDKFSEEFPIVINQDDEIVDGQHRITAAKKYGIKKIPYVRYFFASKKCEAKYFTHINGFNTKQSPIDYWFSAKMAGDRLANIIYKIAENPSSSLYNEIAVKGQKSNNKIAIAQVISIIFNVVGYKHASAYTHNMHKEITARLNKHSDAYICKEVSDYYRWFSDIFGTKPENPAAYRVDTFRVILYFFNSLKELDIAYSKKVINKLKTFRFGPEFNAAPGYGKKYQLINFYNKGKQVKNQLSYE